MTTPQDSDQASGGTSPKAEPRYGSRPRGGPGEGAQSGKKPGRTGYGQTTPPSSGGYPSQQPPPPQDQSSPGYPPSEPEQPPAPPGYPETKAPPEPAPPKGGYPPDPAPDPHPGPATPDPAYGQQQPGDDTGDEHDGGYGDTKPHPCPPSSTCDTSAIDDLQCEAKAVKAESDSLAAVATDLAKRRTAFETARGDYSKARDEASKAVKDLNRRMKDLLSDIKCLLNRDEVDCLDRSFTQVVDCLQECPESQGCCVPDDCGFESETWTVGQIDGLRAQVEKIEKCFDEVLVTEPAALRQRIKDAQKLVDDLTAAMKADPRDDANRLYARAKEARYTLDAIWGPFKDVNEFQRCLCCGLSCSLRGRQLLAQLAGDQAYQTCQEESRKKRCDWLRKNMVDETLAVQLLLCPPGPPCGDEQTATAG